MGNQGNKGLKVNSIKCSAQRGCLMIEVALSSWLAQIGNAHLKQQKKIILPLWAFYFDFSPVSDCSWDIPRDLHIGKAKEGHWCSLKWCSGLLGVSSMALLQLHWYLVIKAFFYSFRCWKTSGEYELCGGRYNIVMSLKQQMTVLLLRPVHCAQIRGFNSTEVKHVM